MTKTTFMDSIGLDSTSARDTSFLDELLIGIQYQDIFFEYALRNKDAIEYQTKKERIQTLSRKYKQKEEDARLQNVRLGASKFTKRIMKKIKYCRVHVKNMREKYPTYGFSNVIMKKRYFTIKQLKALASLGVSTDTIIELFECDMLVDKLERLYINKYRENLSYAALSSGQKKVKEMIGA